MGGSTDIVATMENNGLVGLAAAVGATMTVVEVTTSLSTATMATSMATFIKFGKRQQSNGQWRFGGERSHHDLSIVIVLEDHLRTHQILAVHKSQRNA